VKRANGACYTHSGGDGVVQITAYSKMNLLKIITFVMQDQKLFVKHASGQNFF
jgi:hypothetical protein